jgi:hypothetical protein
MMTYKCIALFRGLALCVVMTLGMLLVPVVTGPSGSTLLPGGQAFAQVCNCNSCCGPIRSCASTCVCTSNKQTKITTEHITEAFKQHRKWMVDIFFKDDRPGVQSQRDTVAGLLEALQIMTNQLTSNAVDQIFMVGMMLDAKHQLETQRLFQQMTAQAHKDYQPSEGMCEVGTMTRSLASSERKGDLTQIAFAQRMNERQLLSGDGLTANSDESDFWSRLLQFIKVYCNPNDNGKGLENLCALSQHDMTRYNRDIDYTASVDLPLTLKVDFTANDNSPDKENIFALSANLFAHKPLPNILPENLVDKEGRPTEGALQLMNLRAIAAKRSVAQNSLAAIVGQKAEGAPESSAFLYSALKEMSGDGISDDEIKKYLGDKPSYFAQMEMLSKKIYQHPGFYTELYDKPANVLRKEAAMEAIELMQKRDIYRSLLRSETLFSVILETALAKEQVRVENEIGPLNQEGFTQPLK